VKTKRTILIRVLATAVAVLATGLAQGASVTIAGGSVAGGAGASVTLPISVQGAQGLGALQMEFTYDPAVLEAVSVEEGALLAGAMVESKIGQAGRVPVALVAGKPISGDGELLKVRFRVLGAAGCAVGIEKARAWDQSTPPLDMLVTVQPGAVTVAAAGTPVWMYGAIGGGAVVLAGLVWAVARKRG
jgi:hypothetical protein